MPEDFTWVPPDLPGWFCVHPESREWCFIFPTFPNHTLILLVDMMRSSPIRHIASCVAAEYWQGKIDKYLDMLGPLYPHNEWDTTHLNKLRAKITAARAWRDKKGEPN